MAIHILPVNDLKQHIEESICECLPSLQFENGEMIFTHNSYDGREKIEHLVIGNRVWHFAFGWCKIQLYMNGGERAVVDLEADEITYYHMGAGYRTYKRPKKGEPHILNCPVDELFPSETKELPRILALKYTALNPTLKFWKSK